MICLTMIFSISNIYFRRNKANMGQSFSRAPQSKQLREDNRGRPYIKDVKEIEVRSSEEAIELLNMGLKRRRIAHTQLNTESSRSHSVLSMRLVQFHNAIPITSLVCFWLVCFFLFENFRLFLLNRQKMILLLVRSIWLIQLEVNV